MSSSAASPISAAVDRVRGRTLPLGATLHSLIQQQAAATPHAVAVECRDDHLTYADLNAAADRMARRLHACGVQPGDLVAISVDRELHRIVGLLGILKVGAAYLPLDPDYPRDRLEYMLADSRARLLLTEQRFSDRFHSSAVAQLLVEQVSVAADGHDDLDVPPSIDSDALCYVIYTSGSTGRPKGVAVSHRAAVHLVWQPDFVDFQATDCFLHHTSMSFDPSVFEIWTPLVNGGRLAILPPGRVSLTRLGRAIRQHSVSILQVATPLFHALVDECLDDLTSLKGIVTGGEAFSIAHVRRALAGLPGTQLSLCYGPTENAAITTCYQPQSSSELANLSFVPLGRPLVGTAVYVLNAARRPVSIGEEGELYCTGQGLAEGYLHRPELTAERFVELTIPDQETMRAYYTGDVVRRHDADTLEFVGRVDQQVKIRGYRVELGEIEAALLRHAAIRQCAVVAVPAASQSLALVAWLVIDSETTISKSELRKHLEQSLPGYLVPDRYLQIDGLPLTPNGKTDRTALQTAERQAAAKPLS